MKTNLKRKMSCFLVMLLLVNTLAGSLTVTAASKKSAALRVGSTFTSGKYKYKVTALKGKSGSVSLIGAKSKAVAAVTIPNTVKSGKYSFSVTGIGNSAFQGYKRLKTVTTNKALKTIGKNAFYGCSQLVKINIKGTSVKSVGKNALKGISKKAVITVPKAKKAVYTKMLKNKGQKATVRVTSLGATTTVSKTTTQTVKQQTTKKQTSVPAQTEAQQTSAAAQTEAQQTSAAAQTEAQQEAAPAVETPQITVPETEAPASVPQTVTPQVSVAAPQTNAAAPKASVAAPQTNAPQAVQSEAQQTNAPQAVQSEAQQTNAPETEHTHKFGGWQETAAATCKAAGMQKRTCEECGETEWQVIPADLNHHTLSIALPDVEATCTTWGRVDVKECAVCGQIFFNAGAAPLGHQFSEEYTVDVEATATEPGVESRHCTHKGCTETADPREIPATGQPESEPQETEPETVHVHQFNEWTRTAEPTCSTVGIETRTCEGCGLTETQEIPASKNAHKRVDLADVEPTCTTWGKHDYWKCEICGQEFFDLLGEEPLGHQFSDDYTVDKAATCTEAGVESKHCMREGCNATTEARAIQATNHTWGEAEVIPATCTGFGYTKNTCTICGATEITGKTNPTGHHWGEETVTPATCMRDGVSRKVCSDCGAVSTLTTLPKTGHNWETQKEEATCEHAGYTLQKCTYCGLIRNKTILPALAHTFEGEEVQHPAEHCYEKGTVTQHCSVCQKDIVVKDLGYGEHYYHDGICKDCGLSENSNQDFSGYIWWVTYKADLEKCVGFNGNGTGDTCAKTLRGDVPVRVKAPDAAPGYCFKGWKITAGSTVVTTNTTNPLRVDTYEKALRELNLLGNKQSWTPVVTIEAVYEAAA